VVGEKLELKAYSATIDMASGGPLGGRLVRWWCWIGEVCYRILGGASKQMQMQ
jgi:hypothetical protein